MQVKHVKSFELDPQVKNYDYSKFAVFTEKGKFLTNIYKHDDVYYSLFERNPHGSIDECLTSLNKFIKKKR